MRGKKIYSILGHTFCIFFLHILAVYNSLKAMSTFMAIICAFLSKQPPNAHTGLPEMASVDCILWHIYHFLFQECTNSDYFLFENTV